MAAGLQDAGTGPGWDTEPDQRHLVQFYETDDYLLGVLSRFVARTLAIKEASVVVARTRHLEVLRSRLSSAGFDIPAAERSGQFVPMEVESIMNRFMVEEMPDPARFDRVFAPVITRAVEEWQGVRVFGEMVALTAEQDRHAATVRMEELWNGLLDRLPFTLYCAYPMSAFGRSDSEALLSDICEAHSTVVPAESYSSLSTQAEQFHEIAQLQQKAARLETEIESRRQAEARLRRALQAERAARQEAENALRLRDEFVSIAAHELKTPLTSLMGRAQFLLRSQQRGMLLNEDHATAAMESVVSQAGKLSRLISQLLDVSRLKGGKLTIERRPVGIMELIREAIYSSRPEIDSFDIGVSGPESLTADIDPLRMEQVIVNLLSNSIKFGPEGSPIEIDVTAPDSESLSIMIRDHGPGIPPENRDRVFERFYQSDHPSSRSGLGLGLYISREIVELHGGSLTAHFPTDGGSRFDINIPLTAPQTGEPPA